MSESAVTPSHSSNSFAVDEVTPASDPIWSEPLRAHLARRFQRSVLLLSDPEKPVVNSVRHVLDSRPLSPEIRARVEPSLVSKLHPLVEAVSLAFSQHRPLTLSPDSIWMVIQQGFAHHVTENAEALRSRLVRHQDKVTLSAAVFDLSPASFESAIAAFSSQIRDATDPVLYESLLCDFSTTTPVIRTASEVVLMDCYSSYFEYLVTCVCGIPRITVTGSIQDWQRIRARIEVLETFGLSWWIDRLRPILDQFIRTVEGHPSLEFWQAIYKPKQAYGAQSITGWIADLFPYLYDPPNRRRNHIFDHPRVDWAVPVEKGVKSFFYGDEGAEKGVSESSFPSGLASVPVHVSFPNKPAVNLDLVAGFLGVEQDAQDLALSSVIGWSVTERPPATPVRV